MLSYCNETRIYTAAIVVNPKASVTLSFGNNANFPLVASASTFSGGAPAYGNKLINAWLKIVASSGTMLNGSGEIELQFENDTVAQIIV